MLRLKRHIPNEYKLSTKTKAYFKWLDKLPLKRKASIRKGKVYWGIADASKHRLAIMSRKVMRLGSRYK